jgi:hypothetical protein
MSYPLTPAEEKLVDELRRSTGMSLAFSRRLVKAIVALVEERKGGQHEV